MVSSSEECLLQTGSDAKLEAWLTLAQPPGHAVLHQIRYKCNMCIIYSHSRIYYHLRNKGEGNKLCMPTLSSSVGRGGSCAVNDPWLGSGCSGGRGRLLLLVPPPLRTGSPSSSSQSPPFCPAAANALFGTPGPPPGAPLSTAAGAPAIPYPLPTCGHQA